MSFTIRGVTLGEGRPKIIVPILAETVAGCVAQATALKNDPAAELVELRLDGLHNPNPAPLADCLRAVRAALGQAKPLLATLRSAGQGGGLALTPEEYAAAVMALCQTGSADLIDLEFDPDHPEAAATLAQAAKAAGAKTVFSHHNFAATPPVGEMTRLLCRMGRAGADIAKLAVMPQTAADAAALLEATALAKAALPGTLLITMSMGALGTVTRVCGGAFGSVATFGAAGISSAPGQPAAANLQTALAALQTCL